MATVNEVVAHDALVPYFALIRRSVESAVTSAADKQSPSWTRTLRATHIWHEAVYQFTRLTRDDDQVVRVDQDNTVLFDIGELLTLRFKKLGADGRISRTHTTGSNRFFNQPLLFPDLASSVNLTVVYSLDETETQVTSIAIAQIGKWDRVQTKWELPEEAIPAMSAAQGPQETLDAVAEGDDLAVDAEDAGVAVKADRNTGAAENQ